MAVDVKICPACGQTIRELATKCRHCKRFLRQCRYCCEWVPAGAAVCVHCDELMAGAEPRSVVPETSATATAPAPSTSARDYRTVSRVPGRVPRRLRLCPVCSMLVSTSEPECLRCGVDL